MINIILKLFNYIFFALIFLIIGLYIANKGYYLNALNKISPYLQLKFDDDEFDSQITIWDDNPSLSHSDLILITTHFVNNPAVFLYDKFGNLKHSWNIKKSLDNHLLDNHHYLDYNLENMILGAVDAKMLKNGDLIVSTDLRNLSNFRGLNISRLDKKSNVIWSTPGIFHHEFDLVDNKIIYALDSSLINEFPLINSSELSNIKFMNDNIVKINADNGEIISKLSISEAFYNSDYKYLIKNFVIDHEQPIQKLTLKNGEILYDLIHTNSVQYINFELSQNSIFNEGDLLISMRGIDTIAVIRPSIKKVIWAQKGIWKNQHYAQLHEDGLIYLYDNSGSSNFIKSNESDVEIIQIPRILSVNPLTNKTNIVFYNEKLPNYSSYYRGYFKKLEDETLLVSSPESSRIMQVDNNGDIIWEMRSAKDRFSTTSYIKKFVSIEHYKYDFAEFLYDLN